MPTDKPNTERPARIALPGGWSIINYSHHGWHITTPDGVGLDDGFSLEGAQAFAAAMAPQDGLRVALEKLRRAAASGYGDMELMEVVDQLSSLFKPQKTWQARWFGSPPMKGAHIWDGDDIVAHIGETESHLEIARKIVKAHNAALAASPAAQQAAIPPSAPSVEVVDTLAIDRLREIGELVQPFDKGPGHNNTTYDLVKQLVEEVTQPTALCEAELRGVKLGLEAAAKCASWAHMVPPDGGSPSEEERLVAVEAENRIRALSPETVVGGV